MFEYLFGTLVEASPHKITLDLSGVGYCIHISIMTYEKLPQLGSKVKIYTSVVYREDSQKIYGFLSVEERNFFEKLNEISGIGPKLSTAILGHMSIGDLHMAVDHGNTKAICNIPGIGKKMADRLVLELRDKFPKFDKENFSYTSPQSSGVVADAISALINLGYNPLEAQKVVKNALPTEGNEPSLSELISLALKSKKV
ncbi:MAG: Holliday junction branch migration protein RuvA [Verrucomicrobia bacterium]|nr:Holliday junction branch migration protein RuvA [Verrucomicrobiota bacterium]